MELSDELYRSSSLVGSGQPKSHSVLERRKLWGSSDTLLGEIHVCRVNLGLPEPCPLREVSVGRR